jgi:DNA-binding NarL/FixJ family response regulator
VLRQTVGRESVLTSREQQVAALVARGLSNAAIAAELHLSERTIESHVGRIMLKLGAGSRAAVAAWQARQGDARAGTM